MGVRFCHTGVALRHSATCADGVSRVWAHMRGDWRIFAPRVTIGALAYGRLELELTSAQHCPSAFKKETTLCSMLHWSVRQPSNESKA